MSLKPKKSKTKKKQSSADTLLRYTQDDKFAQKYRDEYLKELEWIKDLEIRQKEISKVLNERKKNTIRNLIEQGYAKNEPEAEALFDAYSAAVKLRYYEYEWEDIDQKINKIIGSDGFIDLNGY